MAKLNKGQAVEAVKNNVMACGDVQDALGQHLRLMTPEQFRQSVKLVIWTSNRGTGLMPDTHSIYRGDVEKVAINLITRIWLDKIHEYESNDPVIVAERKARSFVYNVDSMLAQANETLTRFKAELEVNPAYAFQSTKAVQAAGDIDIATRAKKMLETHTADEVKSELVDMLRWADGLRLEGSTCPMTNMVDRAKTIAIARLAGLRN